MAAPTPRDKLVGNAVPSLVPARKTANMSDMKTPLDFLKTRKSISATFLVEPGPSASEIKEILTVASRVPDHGKLARWRFILFSGDARKSASESLAKLYEIRHPDADPKQMEEERGRLARAPLVVGVVSTAAPHPKIPEFEQLLAASNAAYGAVLGAHALGYAAQWTTDWFAYDEEAGKLLGLKPGERFVGFIHIGTPDAPPTDRPRPVVAEITTSWTPPEARNS
jgi:nitroreductase